MYFCYNSSLFEMYIHILTWHVLVISFHSFDMMTDVKVLENKSDWIPSLLFFFFFFLFLCCCFLIWSAFHLCLTSAIIIIIITINPHKSYTDIYGTYVYEKKWEDFKIYIYIYILLKQYCGWLWLFLSYQTIWHTYIHLDSLVERKYILINHLLPFSPLFVETHW